MQHSYVFLALEIANERAREAEQYRLARAARRPRRSRLSRLLRELAGNVGAAFTGGSAEEPARRPA